MSYNSPLPPPCMRITIQNPLPVIGEDNRYTCTLYVYPQNLQGGGIQYSVSDVQPNFWISNYPFGEAWKIINVSNVNPGTSTLDAIIEDVEYYNYSIDPDTGEHGPNDGSDGYIWTLAEDGLPNLFPIDNTFPATLNYTYVTDLIGRFRSRNYYTSYVRFSQNSNSFQVGQFLNITSTGSFEVSSSSSDSVFNTIGVITSVGFPTSEFFTIRPFGQYLTSEKIIPPLTQGVGSIYYLNSTGGLTTSSPGSNSYPVYIQVSTGGDGILLKGRFGQTSGGSGTGTIGPTGPQGDIGPQGSIGPTGVQGDVGPQGYQGPTGYQGDIGPQGFQGLQGSTGEVGPQGFQGLQGSTGDVGPQGFQGDVGPQGYQGEIGPTGDIGPQGFQGLQGSTGEIGPQGFQDRKSTRLNSSHAITSRMPSSA